MKRRHAVRVLIGFAIACSLTFGIQFFNRLPALSQGTQIIVSAAASLTDALKDIDSLYRQSRSNVTVRYNFASSGALQQQIENGAPADIFVSAAEKQMDALQQKNLLVPGTRRNLLTNRLVLIVPSNISGINTLRDLSDVRIKRIAIGDPRSVPAGQYADQALKNAGLTNSLRSKFVLANNVRQVLQFVESGNAQAGLVYLTDARTSNKVKIAQIIPANLHSPIVYPIAVINSSKNQTAAKAFVQFLASSQAKQVFRKYGFGIS